MLLKPDERETILTALLQRINSHLSLVALLDMKHARWIQYGGSLQETADNALRYCEGSAWLHQPPALLTLLDRLEDGGISFAALKARLLQERPPVLFPGGQVWRTSLLPPDRPFFDRDDVRQGLEDLVQPDGAAAGGGLPAAILPRVCVVTGPSGQRHLGRTYLYHYLEYRVAVQPTLYDAAYVDFRGYQTARFGPENLLAALRDQIAPGEPIPAVGNESPERWRPRAIRWLVEVGIRTGRLWYIVLDNFDESPVPADTRGLIDALAAWLTMEEADRQVYVGNALVARYPSVRLVLLGYDLARLQELPAVNGLRIRSLSLVPIGKPEIAGYLAGVFAHNAIPVAGDVLDQAAEAVNGVVPAGIPERLRYLAEAAAETARRLLASLSPDGGAPGQPGTVGTATTP